MEAHTLLSIVEEHKDKDPFTFAKIVEQEERTFLAKKVEELGFPWIIPLIENN